jgi:hypothetical protein
MKLLTKEEMNVIWPHTNSNWANEVGTSFFAEKNDLDTTGWLDPWSRPLSKEGWSEYKTDERPNWKYRTTFVYLWEKGVNHIITLFIYEKV